MEILILILCLIVVLAFEFVNGMNDTANAIAPVIYSHSMEPKKSVMLAAVLNFFWVLLWGIAVAMSIIHLLPLSTIMSQPTSFGIAMVLAILISAIIWDLGAWYLALPVSSSHALIGSILWVSITLMLIPAWVGITPHWAKAEEVIIWLLISPLIWFWCALVLIYLAHKFLHKKSYFRAPIWSWDHPTPWMRFTLIGASALVSFMHGKNDGQKWVGIATLILITLLPASFAINPNINVQDLNNDIQIIESTLSKIDSSTLTEEERTLFAGTQSQIIVLKTFSGKGDLTTKGRLVSQPGFPQVKEGSKISIRLNKLLW